MGNKKVYIETYGCQMNVNDTEVIFSILKKAGYDRTENMDEADVIIPVPSGTMPSSVYGAALTSFMDRNVCTRAWSPASSAAWPSA